MRILAVTPYYSPEGGGLERYAHEILRRLARAGHAVSCLAFTRGEPAAGPYDGVEVERRVPKVVLGNAPIDLHFSRTVTDRIRSFEPDVVWAHTPVPFPAEAAFFAARQAGVPFVLTYHAGRLQAASPLLRPAAAVYRTVVERAMLRGAAAHIAVSPFVREHALGRVSRPVSIVPPGVDPERFHPGGETDERRILFVGPLDRAYRWKGVDVLWRAFERLHKDHPQIRLELVGAGDRLEEFRRRAAAFPGAVFVQGRLDEEALLAAYRRAAVLVLPSTTDAESFGMVLAEANACGTPVVASSIGGIPSFVKHGENGYLVPPRDEVALAARLWDLLSDPGRARSMGETGRWIVEHHHDWDLLAAQTLQVMRGVVDRTGRVRDAELETDAAADADAPADVHAVGRRDGTAPTAEAGSVPDVEPQTAATLPARR